ncbi:deoxyribodipyrimidine photo-lyase [Paenibacillus sp. FJAT-26967]|uniref:cryptochrome/photolyase family protein n=1 Tax=Paenibacillus sp. FJAT-26967 TaxID=1729690 RepID=UPI000837F073|nr:deoxyribodipyrimidine photo-lyase [Paenibacillus sp. FJAT-26967]
MILFIHRKDLRIDDLTAFDYIHSKNRPSLHVLILDPFLLRDGREREHSGINFLQHASRLMRLYHEAGAYLTVLYGDPAVLIDQLMGELPIEEIVLHGDVTPYAIVRDRKIKVSASAHGVPVTTFIDHTLADFTELQRYAGRKEPYQVFTPFYKKWSGFLQLFHRPSSDRTLRDLQTTALPDLATWSGRFPLPFELEAYGEPPDPAEALSTFLEESLGAYAAQRDRYALETTSGISRHLNTGALSVRRVYEAALAFERHEAWTRQLAWRDFYLYQAVYNPDFFLYEKKFDLSGLEDTLFERWCRGETGIPVIDAAMTELNTTGHMPNRLRMVTAMFLTKNLRCSFTLGEKYFRRKLTDYDNVINRGGWLWSSSLGFDASPYFRVMNPVTQSETHDPAGMYIRRWLPHLARLTDKEIHLPQPGAIVDLRSSRAQAIDIYRHILAEAKSNTLPL